MANITNIENTDKATITTMYLDKSKSTLVDADCAIKSKRWNMAINRIYYSVFYALNALFEKYGNPIKSYRYAKRTLGKLYVITGKIDAKYGRFFTQLETMRMKADFDVSCQYTEEEIKNFRPKVDAFIASIKKLIDE
ncbi:MAG: HEPN domain-containing protein [Bacteroidales bacterium]|nr:HEPN domain-containing protein [Bacteroidales bacterium]